jgi:hypothetical protein
VIDRCTLRIAQSLLFLTAAIQNPQAAAALDFQKAPALVELASAPEDRTSRRLSALIEQRFGADPRFALVRHQQGNSIIVSMASRVGWERRLDWTEIRYQARLTSPGGQSAVMTAVCWNWDLQSCAKQVVDAAAGFAGR